MTSRCTAWPRCPVMGSAPKRRGAFSPPRAPPGLGAAARRNAANPRHLRRGFAGEVLVILHGDRPVTGSKHDGAANLGILQVLAIDAALGGAPVLHPGDVGNRRLEHADGVARHVALGAASDQVGAQPEARSLGWDGAVVAQHAVGLADAGAEL